MARRRKFLGSIQLLGLNDFGGKQMNPLIGAGIGGGVSFVTGAIARRSGSTKADMLGLGAGLATAGVMYAMKSTRKAAVGAAIGAVLVAATRVVEGLLLGGGLSGLGIPQMRALNGLGIPQMRALNGLGIPAASYVPSAAGTIPGVAGAQLANPGGGAPPISLMGSPSASAMHLLGIGGPPVHGLATSYGATLLGGGR